MCGIAGRFGPAGLPPDPGWRERADRLLRHRGPDGEGSFADDRCELVHRRLALIDLSPTGLQPMGNEDGSVQMIFNGEIYNHRPLRSWLQERGHRFRGTADCEVLPHLYEEEGPALAERLRGMFAFALYDTRAGRLVLVRDRFGIKPLYYLSANGVTAFASEIKALLALTGPPRRVDRQACYDFLGLGYVPEPATAFADIRALPAGCLLIADASSTILRRYHRVEARPDRDLRQETTVDALQEKLERSVAWQSLADVPVAALLSGGIDSSLVVAAHARALGTPIRTFNVRFPDAGYDETPFARAAAAHCRTEHETLSFEEGGVSFDDVLRLLRHFDQPFADTSLIPTYRVCRLVRERGFICALSGDGGDEAFGGYSEFWKLPRLLRLARLPRPLHAAAATAGNHAGDWFPDLGRALRRAAGLARAAQGDPAVLIAGITNYLHEEEKEALVRAEARQGLAPASRLLEPFPEGARTPLESLTGRLTEYLFAVGLASDMLRKVDMMSMLTGLEIRVPLLDEEVVELGLRLPFPLKVSRNGGKVLLRALAERWLPPEVVRHRKQGFRVPLDRVLPSNVGALLRELLLSPDRRTRFLEEKVVRHWLDLFERSQRGAASKEVSRESLYQRVIFLVALEDWMRRNDLTW